MRHAATRIILAPVAAGELLDKISILEIKSARVTDPARRALVEHELEALNSIRRDTIADVAAVARHAADLRAVNEALWDIEDNIRLKEKAGEFDAEFVALARSVYITNDRRAELKRLINEALGSDIVEVKAYA